MSKRLYIIDGQGHAYRAFYAVTSLSTSDGRPTNVVYGFTTMLLRLLREEKPDYLIVSFDPKGPTFRHREYAPYKAHRKKMEESLSDQMPLIEEVVGGFNIPIYSVPNYEADDVIGTIARKAANDSYQVVIMSGDQDLYQLVGPEISVLSQSRGENLIYDRKGVEEKFGVPPEKVIEVKGLMGDSSDNIPGVPGIGAKTAIKLIKEFGDLENLLKNPDQVKGEKLKRSLEEFADQARLSRRLATIDTDVPLELDLEGSKVKEPDRERLGKIFQSLEFKRLVVEMAEEPKKKAPTKYNTVLSEKDLNGLIRKLKASGGFALDTETTSVHPMKAKIVGLSFSHAPYEAYYIPLRHDYLGAPSQLSIDLVMEKMKPILEDKKLKKYGQNIKYDSIVLKNLGVEVRGVSFDTMIASYLLDPGRRGHSLDDLALDHLQEKTTPIESLIGKGAKQISMSEVEVSKASDYACEDADLTYRLSDLLKSKLHDKELDSLYQDVEIPLIDVLAEMETNGVSIDGEHLGSMSKKFATKLKRLTKKIHREAGEEFNINSTQQLATIFYDKLEYPVIRKTKTGRSTAVGVLEELAKEHRLPAFILQYRQLSKLKSTYIDALPKMVDLQTGRIHTSFNQTVAATGRLSSSDPNLQNIPVRTEEGREIREAFVPGSDRLLLSADYSQIELRILAHISQDANLIKAFANDEDIHQRTASEMMDVTPEEVTADMRRIAKNINYGVIYGMGAFRLANELGIDMKIAQGYIDGYFENYTGVKTYMDDILVEAQDRGYVTTLLGRRRYINDIGARDFNRRSFAERTAMNAPIQGSAADLIKLAMVRIYEKMKKEKLESKMILQVHDELVFEVPEDEKEGMAELVTEEMASAIKMDVPIKVDVYLGSNWAEAH